MHTTKGLWVTFVNLRNPAVTLQPPAYQTEGSAGADLTAAIEEPITLHHGQTALVPTGIAIELPQGYEGQIRSRSGLAYKEGVVVLNAPATIDSDYRGEIKVLLINLGPTLVLIQPGQRIAQLVIAPYVRADFRQARAVSDTLRGAGGFGSTGQ